MFTIPRFLASNGDRARGDQSGNSSERPLPRGTGGCSNGGELSNEQTDRGEMALPVQRLSRINNRASGSVSLEYYR